MITLGFDIGTRYIKACVVRDEKIMGYSIRESGRNIREIIDTTREECVHAAGVKKREIKKTVSTGYGASLIHDADRQIGIEQCLSKAAWTLNGYCTSIVDIGGLFIHVIRIDAHGKPADSCENETCASGSGKLLEIISGSMNIPLSSLSETAIRSSNPHFLTSSCAVFAESEIVSLSNQGASKSDLILGILQSIASKVAGYADRVDTGSGMVISGGVAKVDAFKTILGKSMNREISKIPIDPQITGAYGAALIAGDMEIKFSGFFGSFKKDRKIKENK
ncbi:MAG: hypothetical protein JXA07_04710 [Spirochaetes bacterium]|nr:hypothetical protein [Spirochaetota bacterium]